MKAKVPKSGRDLKMNNLQCDVERAQNYKWSWDLDGHDGQCVWQTWYTEEDPYTFTEWHV